MKRQLTDTVEAGFTIIELMIATLVFSMVLIVVTAGVIHVTQSYIKGSNVVNTQSTARNIIDTISQSIQFGGVAVEWPQPTPAMPKILAGTGCIGNQEFNFQLGDQVTPNGAVASNFQAPHALTLTTGASGCAALAAAPAFPTKNPDGTTDLLGEHMRLAKLAVTPVDTVDGLYRVDVMVVYGDYDLLCSTSPAYASKDGGCDNATPNDPASLGQAFYSDDNLTCRTGSGSAYCAVSELSTTVQQRIPF